jgi:hypothetical protein
MDQLTILTQLMAFVAFKVNLYNPDTRQETTQEIILNCPPPIRSKYQTFEQLSVFCDRQIWNRLLLFKAVRGENDYQYCVAFIHTLDFICEDIAERRITIPQAKERINALFGSETGK